jgi:hypothetical protein
MLFLVGLTGAPEAHVDCCYLAILTSRQRRSFRRAFGKESWGGLVGFRELKNRLKILVRISSIRGTDR